MWSVELAPDRWEHTSGGGVRPNTAGAHQGRETPSPLPPPGPHATAGHTIRKEDAAGAHQEHRKSTLKYDVLARSYQRFFLKISLR